MMVAGTYDGPLLEKIKHDLSALEKLKRKIDGEWISIDGPYRFYHASFKVFYLQSFVREIIDVLSVLDPKPIPAFNELFQEIINDCAVRKFDVTRTNANWATETRPIVEAFFHARFFLDVIVKSGRELNEPPSMLPLHWASVLCLYDIR